MKQDFSSHIMFCLSTGNQTVNLLPALQFDIKRMKIFSTVFTEPKCLTQRLRQVAEQRGIEVEPTVHVTLHEEKNITSLVDRLIVEALPHPKIVWNISGGQKIPAIALHTAFYNRTQAGFREDKVLYVEANPPETWWFGADSQNHTVRSECKISLDEILFLYDSIADEKISIYPKAAIQHQDWLQIADKALGYYLSETLFREAFFACMRPGFHCPTSKREMSDMMRKALNAVRTDLSKLSLDVKDYEGFVGRLKDLSTALGSHNNNVERLKKAIESLRIIQKPEIIYESYWNEIRKRTMDIAINEIEMDRVKLHVNPLTETEFMLIQQQLVSIGGEVRSDVAPEIYRENIKFSELGSNSTLFEWMVAAAVMRAMEMNPGIKERISEIHLQCKTKSASEPSARHDAELDLVITTRFGTLIILEVKTYDFSGDTAKGKDHSAYRKSGPYGKAVMVGPLISSFIQKDSAGMEQYPHYIDGKIQEQKTTAAQNRISYCFLDGMQQLLERELAVSSVS